MKSKHTNTQVWLGQFLEKTKTENCQEKTKKKTGKPLFRMSFQNVISAFQFYATCPMNSLTSMDLYFCQSTNS